MRYGCRLTGSRICRLGGESFTTTWKVFSSLRPPGSLTRKVTSRSLAPREWNQQRHAFHQDSRRWCHHRNPTPSTRRHRWGHTSLSPRSSPPMDWCPTGHQDWPPRLEVDSPMESTSKRSCNPASGCATFRRCTGCRTSPQCCPCRYGTPQRTPNCRHRLRGEHGSNRRCGRR